MSRCWLPTTVWLPLQLGCSFCLVHSANVLSLLLCYASGLALTFGALYRYMAPIAVQLAALLLLGALVCTTYLTREPDVFDLTVHRTYLLDYLQVSGSYNLCLWVRVSTSMEHAVHMHCPCWWLDVRHHSLGKPGPLGWSKYAAHSAFWHTVLATRYRHNVLHH